MNQIVSEIESRFSVADKPACSPRGEAEGRQGRLEQTIDEGLKKAETLRQSVLKKAFEGRLV